jgi:hypothetical protein
MSSSLHALGSGFWWPENERANRRLRRRFALGQPPIAGSLTKAVVAQQVHRERNEADQTDNQ